MPEDPCASDLNTHFDGVPGFATLKTSLYINGKFHVPFGTMFWAPGSAAPGGVSMNFGEANHAKMYDNFLWKPTDGVATLSAFSDASLKVGAAAALTLQTNTFAGVEVGNLQPYFDVVNYAGTTDVPSQPTVVSKPEALAKSGWGLPLCMNDVPTSCPSNTTCKVAVNCINRRMLDGFHLALQKTGGILARTRPDEFGAITRFYDTTGGSDTTRCTGNQVEVRTARRWFLWLPAAFKGGASSLLTALLFFLQVVAPTLTSDRVCGHPKTCAEARDTYGVGVDGVVTLDLVVDALKIIGSDLKDGKLSSPSESTIMSAHRAAHQAPRTTCIVHHRGCVYLKFTFSYARVQTHAAPSMGRSVPHLFFC